MWQITVFCSMQWVYNAICLVWIPDRGNEMIFKRGVKMKKIITLMNFEDSYDIHLEEITRLQNLLAVEEQKLFRVIKSKKQKFIYEEPGKNVLNVEYFR